MKHVIHPSSSPKPNPAVSHDEEAPSPSRHLDESELEEQSNGTESSSSAESQPESDDHAWLPENWRQAALVGRQKVAAAISPKVEPAPDANTARGNEPSEPGETATPERVVPSATQALETKNDPGPEDDRASENKSATLDRT